MCSPYVHHIKVFNTILYSITPGIDATAGGPQFPEGIYQPGSLTFLTSRCIIFYLSKFTVLQDSTFFKHQDFIPCIKQNL